MPLEVPFRPSIVLIAVVVIVVNIVYVVVSRGRLLSLPFVDPRRVEKSARGKTQGCSVYIRSADFFHGFRQSLRRSFFQTALVCAHVLCTRVAAALSSAGVITFVFPLTLHRQTESRQNTWKIKSGRK